MKKIKNTVQNPHSLSVEEILDLLRTSQQSGLEEKEVKNRIKKYGLNIYQTQKLKSVWIILLLQFKNPIVYLLIFGVSVSLYFQDYIEAIAIAVVILINAFIGFFMEMQARSSMEALKKMDVILSRVLRDGKVYEISSEHITIGDIVLLEAGDVIPGDGRLIDANQLQCEESALTGESLPSEKLTHKLPVNTIPADQTNMVFKGSSVMNGKARAVITTIAQNTQLGSITSLVEQSADTVTPLDRKLNLLSKNLIWITLALTVVFAMTGVIQGQTWEFIIKTSIALAVAAIPEGLPIVATVALAYGMLLLAKQNAVVKRLASVETLGSTNVILTDKTGTLTENSIHVDTFSFPDEQIKVKIEKKTLIFENQKIINSTENYNKLRVISALCNNVVEEKKAGKKKLLGDPIEIALINMLNASGKDLHEIKNNYDRISEIPFSSETKIMGTLHEVSGEQFVAAKGSVENLLEKCTMILKGGSVSELNQKEINHILKEGEKMAATGLRILAFAYKTGKDLNKKDFVSDLIYIGMISFLDPPRLDIKDAILTCRKAGIKIVMITGDHPKTALNIAHKVGLIDENENEVITGKALRASVSDSVEWKNKILRTPVFARTTPAQKLEITEIYQKDGNIVAMLGDGVNDAPALKKADIGIAMGLRGTQVAKETADIILKDDSFSSIVNAVSHGREIFQNIQKFVVYLFSCNLSEIFIVTTMGFLAPLANLLPLQILFLNLVTDVFPALALGVGKGDETIMDRMPRDPKKNIITRKNWITIGLYSVVITISVICAVTISKWYISNDDTVSNNVAFITLTFAQLFHVFNMSSPGSKLLKNDITKNKFIWYALGICILLLAFVFISPYMRFVLDLQILPLEVWILSVVAGLIPLLIIRLFRIIRS
ncbi:MAG: cation-translocating P-type ATPase [Saprospiraceae bacterium]|nr:cation-translocating P-type ATPase [Saprospiraceae bacterium]